MLHRCYASVTHARVPSLLTFNCVYHFGAHVVSCDSLDQIESGPKLRPGPQPGPQPRPQPGPRPQPRPSSLTIAAVTTSTATTTTTTVNIYCHQAFHEIQKSITQHQHRHRTNPWAPPFPSHHILYLYLSPLKPSTLSPYFPRPHNTIPYPTSRPRTSIL